MSLYESQFWSSNSWLPFRVISCNDQKHHTLHTHEPHHHRYHRKYAIIGNTGSGWIIQERCEMFEVHYATLRYIMMWHRYGSLRSALWDNQRTRTIRSKDNSRHLQQRHNNTTESEDLNKGCVLGEKPVDASRRTYSREITQLWVKTNNADLHCCRRHKIHLRVALAL